MFPTRREPDGTRLIGDTGRSMLPFHANGESGLRVLVVEDEPMVREIAVQELIDAGYEVVEAASGDEALGRIGAEPRIDVLFTDIRMPGATDGWQLAERFRAAQPNLLVLYATGFAASQTPVTGSLFFRKPYKMSQVIWGIRALAGQESQPA